MQVTPVMRRSAKRGQSQFRRTCEFGPVTLLPRTQTSGQDLGRRPPVLRGPGNAEDTALCKTGTVAISLHLRIWACRPFAPDENSGSGLGAKPTTFKDPERLFRFHAAHRD